MLGPARSQLRDELVAMAQRDQGQHTETAPDEDRDDELVGSPA